MTKILHKCLIKDGQIVPDDTVGYHTDIEKFEGKEVEISFRKWKKTRTIRQNNSLWLWFQLLATEMNLKGIDMRAFIKADVEIEWTKDSIRHYLWKPLQRAMFGETSTTKLTTEQINKIYDNLNRIIAERTKGEVNVPFPCLSELFKEK